MYSSEEIVAGVQALLPRLPDLLGGEAEDMRHELHTLLVQLQAGQKTEAQVLAVLDRQASTRQWFAEYIQSQPDEPERLRPQDKLPDLPVASTIPLFRCPQGDYEWFRPVLGIPIPLCPFHHVPLVQVV